MLKKNQIELNSHELSATHPTQYTKNIKTRQHCKTIFKQSNINKNHKTEDSNLNIEAVNSQVSRESQKEKFQFSLQVSPAKY